MDRDAQSLKLSQVPIEQREVTVNGVRWRYQHAGDGAPLLLLHGLLGYSFSWRHAMPVWGRDASVFGVDMPGAGFSEFPPGLDCSLAGSAGRVLGFMDKVGIDSCDLLGTSHGGGVAMMVAAMARSRVRRLVLVAPINPWSGRGAVLSVFLSKSPITPVFKKAAPFLPLLHERYLRSMFGDARRMRPGTLQGYTERLRRPRAFEYGLGVLHTWNSDLRQLRSALHKIAEIPTLLIWGSLDGAVYSSSGPRLAQEFRNAQLVMMDGVGHLPYEEMPEEFNRTVEEFLKKK